MFLDSFFFNQSSQIVQVVSKFVSLYELQVLQVALMKQSDSKQLLWCSLFVICKLQKYYILWLIAL